MFVAGLLLAVLVAVHGRYYGPRGYGGYGNYFYHQIDERPLNPFGSSAHGLDLNPYYAYSKAAYQDLKYQQMKYMPYRHAPYFDYGNPEPITATCVMTPANGNGNVRGEVKLLQDGRQLRIGGMLLGLSPGNHGFHIHEFGELGSDCSAAGGHYNPEGNKHGGPNDLERHAGDLGNVVADGNGVVELNIQDDVASLPAILNRAIVIHEGEDDLGRGGDAGSMSTGNAGARAGCCTITAK